MALLKKSLFLAALFCVVATPAEAARRDALRGNMLILDKDDTFVFPQLAVDHLNAIWFDYGTAENQGSGLMLFGSKTFVLGVAVNRSEVTSALGGSALDLFRLGAANPEQGNLGAPGEQFSLGAFLAPHTIVDVILAFPVGGRNKLGFRLGLTNDLDYNKPDGGDEASTSEFGLKLQGGLSLPNPSFGLDLGLEINYGSGSTVAGGDPAETGTFFLLGLRARAFSRMSERTDLGLIAEIGFGSENIVNHNADDDVRSRSDFLLILGAGPTYKLGKATVNGHAVLGLGVTSQDPSSEGEDDARSDTSIVLPGVRMSFETPLLSDIFFFRSGMEYVFVLNSGADEPGNAIASRDGSFGWSAGLGLVLDKFTFDGTLTHAWLTNMPTAVGAGGQMFAMASASYDW